MEPLGLVRVRLDVDPRYPRREPTITRSPRQDAPAERLVPTSAQSSFLRNPATWIVLLVAIGAGIAIYLWRENMLRQAILEQLPQSTQVTEPLPTTERAEPEILHPLPLPSSEQTAESAQPAAPAKPLPILDQSDNAIRESLAEMTDKQTFDDIPLSKDLIRHLVVTIDNLPRRQLAARLLPLKPPAGAIATTGQGDVVLLNSANYARYSRYVRVAQAVDSKRVVGIYVHYYPLFQQAYAELGYPKKHFNDRLVEVIDHLLAAPDVAQPVPLVRPKVLYEFENPDLEDLSVGKKLLIRMGPENAAAMKGKLRELRAQLASAPN